jgi:hypothetical protein
MLKGKKLRGAFVLTQLKGKGVVNDQKNDAYAQPNFEMKPELTHEKRG